MHRKNDVIIKGWKLPSSDGVLRFKADIEINPDGTAYFITNNYKYQLQELQPHGDLIEKDPIIKFIEKGINKPGNDSYGYDGVEILTEVAFADVIVKGDTC